MREGALVGVYRIQQQIGRGGMGVVYRAEQTTLGRLVALKVISPDLAQEPAFRERFRRESRLAAAIDHPNIIPVYEAEMAGDLLFIAMRYVDGTDLRAIIQREGPLNVRRAAQIVAQVADALAAAHERQLVHRDVKPANVLIVGSPPGEHAYLTDFGLTKHMASDSALTETGQWVGTLDFIAPEQIMGGDIDGRADVYSLGCVFFETLTGQPPFPRDVDVAKIYAHLNEPPPRVTDALPELSPDFDAVIARALAKDREDRYATAGEFRAAVLNLISAREPIRTPGPAPRSSAPTAADPRQRPVPPQPYPGPRRQPPPRRATRLVVLALILVALGAAAGIAAASGLFSGNSSSTAPKVSRATTAAPAQPTSAPKPRHKKTTTSQTPPPVVTPPPRTAGLESFQTGITGGRTVAATYCDVRSSTLYCWTPDDGYTIEIPADGRAQRLRSDKVANTGRTPGGYTTLGIGKTRSGSGFTCTSQVTGLTCMSNVGYGFDLPRDKGLPACFDPQGAAVLCE
jgi:serine/threonine-protein kinase